MKKTFLLSILIVSFLGGCHNEETHDVQYYLDHKEERKIKISECANNPGEKANTPNCLNANQAQYQDMFSGSDMPKIRTH